MNISLLESIIVWDYTPGDIANYSFMEVLFPTDKVNNGPTEHGGVKI